MIERDEREMDAAINTFLDDYSPDVQAVVLEIRSLVFEIAPQVIEQLDVPAKMLAYGFRKTYKDMICVVMPLSSGVNLGFPRGANLPDPAGLLTGTGKRARHVRISSLEIAHSQEIRTLLLASIAQISGS